MLGRVLLVSLIFAISPGAMAFDTTDSMLAWQMETVEPSQNRDAPSFGGNRTGGVEFGVEPVRPGSRGRLFEGGSQRPGVFGEGREPLFRPGMGRNCTGEGPGRVCF